MARIFNQTNNSFNQSVFFDDPLATGPITITQSGVISESASGVGLLLNGGAYTVSVNGQLTATAAGSYGLSLGVASALTPNQVSSVSMGATGEIYGAAYAISAFHAVNLTNRGLLHGDAGVYIAGGAVSFSVTNYGEIYSAAGVAAIWTDGAGAHDIRNYGTITGRIEGAFSVDSIETITNAGQLYGDIWARGGNDRITNSLLIQGNVYLDAGDDYLSNNGSILGDVSDTDGANAIYNQGLIRGRVFGGVAVDTLKNKGVIDGDVGLGPGNDYFVNTGAVTGWIFLGEGDDRLMGGATRENVADEAGADRVYLGDGVDNVDAVGVGSAIGFDVFDGGSNTNIAPEAGIFGDEYNASEAVAAVFANLDTVAHTDAVNGRSYAASRVRGADTGTDVVLNFETIYTGAGDDIVFGNAADNFIAGFAGNDRLYSGAGDDIIGAGEGADRLTGGLGGDVLDGGLDTDADVFAYLDLTDSTVALAGRDVIENFTEADRIDFSGMAAGLADHFVGTDVAFDGVAGAVRVLRNSAGWTIQLDSNGDRGVDLAIDVNDAGHTNVTDWTGNFVF